MVFSGRSIKRLLQLLNPPDIKAWMSFSMALIAQIRKPWTATSQTHFLSFPAVLFVFLEITSYYICVVITKKHLLFSRDNEIILWRSPDNKLCFYVMATESRRVTVQSTTTCLLADGKETTNILRVWILCLKKVVNSRSLLLLTVWLFLEKFQLQESKCNAPDTCKISLDLNIEDNEFHTAHAAANQTVQWWIHRL